MGYVCPVCSVAATDAVTIANHLAVTASLGREDHLEWLESHASDWEHSRPAELAETVRALADEIPDPETTDAGPLLESEIAAESQRRGRGAMAVDPDPDAAAVLEEARALTQEMTGERDSDTGLESDPEENG